MTWPSSWEFSSSGGMPQSFPNCSFSPAMVPSEVTTRTPSAVDSRVAASSERVSRSWFSVWRRSLTSRTLTITSGAGPLPRWAALTSIGNSVPPR